jgi:DNA-binding PadR family transcriptional regulator
MWRVGLRNVAGKAAGCGTGTTGLTGGETLGLRETPPILSRRAIKHIGGGSVGQGDTLAAFEQIVLLALLSLDGDEAYGMNIRRVLLDEAGRDVSVPTVYSALDRLESKGFVTSRLGAPTPERGGRAKKLFHVEPEGVRALHEVRRTLENMWEIGGLATGAGDG